jgi:hypothetical protein
LEDAEVGESAADVRELSSSFLRRSDLALETPEPLLDLAELLLGIFSGAVWASCCWIHACMPHRVERGCVDSCGASAGQEDAGRSLWPGYWDWEDAESAVTAAAAAGTSGTALQAGPVANRAVAAKWIECCVGDLASNQMAGGPRSPLVPVLPTQARRAISISTVDDTVAVRQSLARRARSTSPRSFHHGKGEMPARPSVGGRCAPAQFTR